MSGTISGGEKVRTNSHLQVPQQAHDLYFCSVASVTTRRPLLLLSELG